MNLMAEIFTVLLRIVCYGYVENTQRLTKLLPFEKLYRVIGLCQFEKLYHREFIYICNSID